MSHHQQFGKPPTLRPRSAGIPRASPRSLGPDQLAATANASASATLLNERLQIPRPGSASYANCSESPDMNNASSSSSSTPVEHTETHVPSHGMQPAVLLSQPPMRPRSVMPSASAAARGIVSQHRKDAVKPRTSAHTSSNQQQHLAPQLQRVALATVNVDSVRGEQATPRAVDTVAVDTSQSTRHQRKRPFSAAPTRSSVAVGPLSAASSTLSILPKQPQLGRTDNSKLEAPGPRLKRPFSASAALSARGNSPRHAALLAAQPPPTVRLGSTDIKDQPRAPERVARAQPLFNSSSAIKIISTFHRDTFVYAVPRHFLQLGLQYNPYDIVTVSHEALFGPSDSGRPTRAPRYDYYTVSGAGMTFHCKEDNFEPSFLQTGEWERQKASFDTICKLPTFQLFRYRKAFLGWKRWIRSTKIDNARAVLLSTLYFSQPMLNKAMHAIQLELRKLEPLDLVCDLDGETHHLSQFSAKSSDHVQRQGFELLAISGSIQRILLQVCHECLMSTENLYGGFPGHQFALSTRKSSNFHIFEAFIERERALSTANNQLIMHEHFHGTTAQPARQISPSKAAQLRISRRKELERVARAHSQRPEDALDEIRWTMAAIQRRRCLLLTKFVALVDFMVVDAFHSLLLRSIQRLRDTLWVGANAVPIARLTERQDFVLAFHQTLDSRQNPMARTTMASPGPVSRSLKTSAIALNKQQTKRFLRAALEPKMEALVRATPVDGTANPNEDQGELLKSSKAVWMKSRLDAFFMSALAQQAGQEADHFTLDDLLQIVEQSFAAALVLPDFDASRCDIEDKLVSPTAEVPTKSSDIQQIETLAPVALFHMSLELHIDSQTNEPSVAFTPTLDRVVHAIQDALTSYLELFRVVLSIVVHQELRSILEFADDFRASSIGDRDRADDNQDAGNANDRDEEDEAASRWNKSNYDRLYRRVANDESFLMLRQNVDELTSSVIDGANAFAKLYEPTLKTFTCNEKIDFEHFRLRFRRGEYSLREMETDANDFQAQIETVKRFKVAQMVEFLHFDMTKLKESLLPSPQRCLHQLHVLFPSLAAEKCDTFLAFVRRACQVIEKPLGKDRLEAFTKYLLHLRDVQNQVDVKEFDLTFIHDFLLLLNRLNISIPDEVGQLFELCEPEFEALKSQMNEALAKRDADINEYTPILVENVKKLTAGVEDLKTQSANQMINSGESVSHDARTMANALESQAGQLTQESIHLVWIQRVFNEFAHGARPPFEEFTDLQYVAHELKLKNELWEAVNDAEKYLDAKQDETLRDLDLGELKSIQGKIETVIKRLHQNLLQISAVKRLEGCKSVLEGLSPVIRDLRNEALEERHWTKLEHKMSCSFVRHVDGEDGDEAEVEETKTEADGEPKPTTKQVKFLDLPLRHLLENKAVDHAVLIHQVSEEANAEAAIAKSFHAVALTWETREIPSHAKKDREGRDAVCLGDCSEIMTLLEESEVLLRVMESSTFSRVIHSKLTKLLHDLTATKETMELLAMCQQKWEYLQRLVSVDFVRSFPEQSKSLQGHDANWKAIMDGVTKKPQCLPFGIHSEHRHILQSILHGFELAANCLEQHLEMKRQCFPAFYKLSNFELATLLSRVRDINNIQQFLYQCFDNVAQINFGIRDACQDILSIRSRGFPSAEVILMGKNLKARGPPEQWLVAIEKRLVEVLRKGTKEAVAMLSQAGSSATTSAYDSAALHALPLQCVVLADRILRSELVDSLLVDEEELGSVPTSTQDLVFAKLHQFHTTILARVFSEYDSAAAHLMTPREIATLACLRLHEIEFRDCVEEHFGRARDGAHALGVGVPWSLQLKHRFDDTTTVGYDCHVEVDNVRTPYGYNYVNVMATSDLVFTPRSMRFVHAVFAATRHAQTVLLTGAPGTGKCSLALKMSTLFGRRFFGWRSAGGSDGTGGALCQLAHYLRLLRGALQGGGVLCFSMAQQDATMELLRVMASTVHRIEHAVLCKLPITDLQKDPIQWIPGTTLLVSYRLSSFASADWYSTRHSLDTVAASFARISVVVDHSEAVVLEALMYSKQFESPREIALQLTRLWSHLASVKSGVSGEGFFSLRSAKQVVSQVAEQVWANDEAFERYKMQCFLMCEAIMDVCKPLLSSEPVNERVVGALNLFFDYDKHQREWYVKQWRRKKAIAEATEMKKMEEMIEDAAHELHYLPRRPLVSKAVELAHGLGGNIGAITVGPSGVGKTTAYTVLARALDRWKHELIEESHNQQSAPATEDAHVKAPGPSSFEPAKSVAKASTAPLNRLCVVLPKALTQSQLIGSTAIDSKGQQKSLLARLIREAQESYALSTDHEIQYITHISSTRSFSPLLVMQQMTWVIFDGGAVCDGVWLDVLLSVLSRRAAGTRLDSSADPDLQLIAFADGEFMTVPPNLRFVFETWTLQHASPVVLQENAIVVFPSEALNEPTTDDEASLPLHYACIHRFIERHRLASVAVADEADSSTSRRLTGVVYDTVTNRLLGTDILSKIFTVMEDYGVAIQLTFLQRVECMLALLQALLNHVAATCAASIKRSQGETTTTTRSTVIAEEDVIYRVEMVMVYAILWGFSACSNARQRDGDIDNGLRTRALQLLISGMIRSHFEGIAHAWEDCGRDANLFELLLDVNGLRFVSLESGDTTILRDKLWRHSIAEPQTFQSLFVPTMSSLIVHAVMKEAIRSARGVLLIGTDTSRKTTLVQNFLKQLQALRVLTTSNYASIPPPAQPSAADTADAPATRRKRAIPLNRGPLLPATESAFASLDRIRLHQVGLVKRLAKRFRKVNKATAAAAALALAQRHSKAAKPTESNGESKSKGPKKELDWAIPCHLDSGKAGMVAKFDLGDFIPFFFAMNQHDRGIVELAKCLDRMLQRERSGIYEPPPGKAAVLIIDDLHLPIATRDEEYPSCHEFLRSAYEHNSVLSIDTDANGDTATPIMIENLMMVATISDHTVAAGIDTKSKSSTQHPSLDKLVKQFLPMYAAACSPLELYSIFHALVVVQWEQMSTSPLEKVSAVVRQALPMVVAAITVLWQKLKLRASTQDFNREGQNRALQFKIHDLSRVYAGVCAVEPSYLLDGGTMVRLVVHELLRAFGDTPAGINPQWKALLRADLFKLRVLFDTLEHQPLSRSQGGVGTVNTANSSATSSDMDLARASNLNPSTNAVGYLHYFTTELLNNDGKIPGGGGDGVAFSAQQRATYERKNLHKINRWAYVPSTLYYQTSAKASASTVASSSAHPSPLQRRNSVKFIRRKSLETGAVTEVADVVQATLSKRPSLGATRWIYAELPFVDGDSALEDGVGQVIQSLFAGIRIFGTESTTLVSKNPVTDLLLQMQVTQLPRSAPPVSAAMAHNLITLERVLSQPGARVAVIGTPGSMRETLLRYACAVRQSTQPHRIWTVEGVADAQVMAAKWKHVVHQLFYHVGVECETVTLLVKDLPKWTPIAVSQLLALMVAGEIPGAFTLEEQIKLATKVRDERLVDVEQQYQYQAARIRQEVEVQKEQEMLLTAADGTSESSSYYQELERKYQHALLVRLSHVQLRHQQELDDFMRKCEVENESVTATIMSLMRPLGMTSGKWQQIVQRMRKRLKVVVVIDEDDCAHIEATIPQLFSVCSVATMAPLDDPASLQVALYGNLYHEMQHGFRHERIGIFPSAGAQKLSSEERAGLVEFIDRVDHTLPTVAALAAEMHRAVTSLAERENRVVPTESALQMTRFFPTILSVLYHRERDERRKAEWFMYVHSSMEKALWKLQDRDDELEAQLESCDQQIEVSQELLGEQSEDCHRIRDMMKRFQDAAEDQVQITNEMEQRAQAELHVPMACLEEANAALLMINKRHIIEIKSFNSPPILVHLVLDAICVMFQLEPAWENARKILADANVVHTLLTYDKDNIPLDILTKLESTYIGDPRFHREEVEKQSVAASTMVVWVCAIYQYATARRQVMPTLEKLEQAQSRLKLLMQEYQVSKQRVVEADEALAKTKDTLAKAKELRQQTVDDIESRKSRLDGGRVVLEILKDDKVVFENATKRIERERAMGLTWWNALFVAGALTYAHYFETGDRKELFRSWAVAYKRLAGQRDDESEVRVSLVPAISLSAVEAEPSYEEEASGEKNTADPHELLDLFSRRDQHWELASACGFLFSSKNMQDAYLLTQVACAGFPVFMITSYTSDMEELLVKCARHIWKWTQLYMVSARASDLTTTVTHALEHGHQLLILDIEPLDLEYKMGKLWSLFHWHVDTPANTSSSDTDEDRVEKLILHTGASDGGDAANESTAAARVPIHPSFRAVLATFHDAAAFGASLTTRVPVLSAKMHVAEVPDILLDRIWHPGVFEGGQHGFGLEQSVREFERLSRQYDDAEAQLTKLIQSAAVRGEFQREETDQMREACGTTQALRRELKATRIEIDERIRGVLKQQTLARLGAAIFSGVNGCGLGEPVVSFQVYLPMWTLALRRPGNQPQVHGATKRLGSSSDPGLMLRAASRVGLDAQQQAQGSIPSLLSPQGIASQGTGLDSISAIMKKMLKQLMPLLRDAADWYKFVVHLLWLLERQYPVEIPDAHTAAVEAIETLFASNTEPRLRRFLSLVKLSRWKSQAVCSEYVDLPTELADGNNLVSLMVNGHAGGSNTPTSIQGASSDGDHLTPVFAASRCRAERVKTTMAMYPELLRPLCERILQVYGVHVRFVSCENEELLAEMDSTLSTAAYTQFESHHQSTTSEAQSKTGWGRVADEFPDATCMVLRTTAGFGTFALLQRLFQCTLPTRESQLAILKAVATRTIKANHELDDVFLLPNSRLKTSNGGHGLQQSAISTMEETTLMIRDPATITQLERDKLESFLDDVPLALVNLLEPGDGASRLTCWEDLYLLLNPSPQRITSTELRRFEHVHVHTAGSTGGGPVAIMSPSRSQAARRMSTQGLQHRRLDAAALLTQSSTLPPLLLVARDVKGVPVHLASTVIPLVAEASDLALGQPPSMKRGIEETLLRLAFHPIGRHIVSTCEGDAATESKIPPLLFHSLTALVVYHSVLLYRWRLMLCQYSSLSTLDPMFGHYSWDVFISALDQLLQVVSQLRATSSKSSTPPRMPLVMSRIKHQVFLATYTRQARSEHEFAVLKVLCRECVCLIQDSLTDASHAATEQLLAIAGSRANLLGALGIVSSTRSRSHRVLNPSGPSSSLLTATPPICSSTSSRKLNHRRSSLGDLTLSLLSTLNLPLDRLRSSSLDLESWVGIMWSYAGQVDHGMESHLRDLFGLLPPAEVELIHHPYTRAASASWIELFGWIKQPVRYDSVASQIALHDALRCLHGLRDKILPPVIHTEQREVPTSSTNTTCIHDEGDGEEGVHQAPPENTVGDEDTNQALESTPELMTEREENTAESKDETVSLANESPAAEVPTHDPLVLHSHLVESVTHEYNSQIDTIRGYLDDLIEVLEAWTSARAVHLDRSAQRVETLQGVPRADVRDTVLTLLCNQIPASLLQVAPRLASYLAANASLTLDEFVAYHQRLYRNLVSLRSRGARPNPIEWWLPGLSRRMSIDHVIHLAKLRAHDASMSQDVSVVFSLRVDGADPAHDDHDSELAPDNPTFAVLSGLELRFAVWDMERGYLQPLVRQSRRQPQRVSVLCRLDKRQASGSQPKTMLQQSKQQHLTRSCPLLSRDDVVYVFHLPVGPAFGSLVAPCLVFALP